MKLALFTYCGRTLRRGYQSTWFR